MLKLYYEKKNYTIADVILFQIIKNFNNICKIKKLIIYRHSKKKKTSEVELSSFGYNRTFYTFAIIRIKFGEILWGAGKNLYYNK